MVNVFGDRGASPDTRPGPCGPRGTKEDPGKSGIEDMCRWIPDLTLEQFQKRETCCFLFKDPAKDLTKTAGGAYVTWISRSGSKMNGIYKPSEKVLYISKTHNALVFIKLLYEVKDAVLSPVKSHVSLCVTYLVLGDEDQTIVTNYNKDNPNLPSLSSFKTNLLKFARPPGHSFYGIYNKFGIKLLTKIRVEFPDLRDHRFNHNFNCVSPVCNCGEEDETSIHFFL